ncbi:MAG: Gfo/Idh/MocA family oxidoreductase [Rhodospirillaceae bacterium]|nr:Gfo/Idh/MocA family oxidoreductase [Rhodospirillales bacterium]
MTTPTLIDATPIDIALVGVGPVSAWHVAALKRIPGVRISACAARSMERAQAFAAEHDIPRARLIDDMLANPEADGLIVVVPAHVMASVALRAAPSGVPLLLEKPVGLDPEETAAVAEAVRAPNMVGLNRRFFHVLREGRRLMAENGGIRHVEVHDPEYTRAAAAHHDPRTVAQWQFANSVHLVDLFRFFAGDVTGVSTNNTRRDDFDRCYSGLLTFQGGALGNFLSPYHAPGGWRVALYGDEMSVVFQPIERATVLRRGQSPEIIEEPAQDGLRPGYFGQAQAFVQLLRTGVLAEGAADLREYLASVRLIDALTRV